VKNQFITRLDCSPDQDGVYWTLNKPLKYIDHFGRLIVVPAGFTTDFASIPPLSTIGGSIVALGAILAQFWPFWWLLAAAAWVVAMLSSKFEHEGTWDEASCLHDYLYHSRITGFWRSNLTFYEAMKAKGGGFTPRIKRWILFMAVNLGGYKAWRDDGRGGLSQK